MQKLMVKFSYSELKIVDGKFICSMQEKQKKKKKLANYSLWFLSLREGSTRFTTQ